MTWLVCEEVALDDFQDCAVVYWPLITSRPTLHLEAVEFDPKTRHGVIYHRDTALVDPEYDVATGQCRWTGYEWRLVLVRRTQHRALELPDDAGALVGRFPDSVRGLWLVFAPASRKPARELRGPRPPSGQRSNASRPSAGPKRPEAAIPTVASVGRASSAAEDIDLLGG